VQVTVGREGRSPSLARTEPRRAGGSLYLHVE
jgi:hypothetical protein